MIGLAIRIFLALQTTSTESNSSEAILVEKTRKLAPTLDVATAKLHVESAIAAAKSQGLQPELLLAVAYVESRFDPTATSRVEIDRRKTGRWASEQPAGTGPRFCGIMQTQAGSSWATCLVMRDLDIGYLVGARELKSWLRYCHGDVACTISGHGGGFAGVKKSPTRYASRVLRVRASFFGPH